VRATPRHEVVLARPEGTDAVGVPHVAKKRAAFSVGSPGWTSGGAMDATSIYVGNERGIFAYARADGARRVVTETPASIHALAADADALYWFSEDNVLRVAKSGGEPTVVAVDQHAHGDPIVADAEHVYWASWGTRLGASPGMRLWVGSRRQSPRRIAELGEIGSGDVRALAVDEGRIYVGVKDSGSAIWVVPTSGGVPAAFCNTATGYGIVDAFAFDPERVYWIDNERKKVFWCAKVGGTPTKLARVTNFGSTMAISGAWVYWGQNAPEIHGTVQRVGKAGGGMVETLVTAPRASRMGRC
jgi:hypothetical protein